MAPLIVITGPTASGKTSLALELAECYDGEIICADSRTVYRGMDIGTAKPTVNERRRVPHHLLDVVEPDEHFSVVDFQRQARAAIADIRSRNKVPFMVGGTGLYIDSVVLNYNIDTNTISKEELIRSRKALESKSIEELQQLIKKQRLIMPYNLKNKRHLVGALLRAETPVSADNKPAANVYIVAITTNKDQLEKRIRTRAEQMFAAGVVDEARSLAQIYGWDNESMTGNIYPLLRQVLNAEITQSEALERFVIRDRRLAKRQITWLRRHDYIQWLSPDEVRAYITRILGVHEL